MGADAFDAGPDGHEVGDTCGELMHVERHFDLAWQGCCQGDQQGSVADFRIGDIGRCAKDEDQCDESADGAPALAHQDGADLGDQGIVQALPEIAVPEREVVTVAFKDVVPGVVGTRCYAIFYLFVG